MKRRIRGAVLLFPLTAFAAAATADGALTNIPLHHRVAEDLMPAIQPLLEAGESIIPAQGMLILKAGPATRQNVIDLVRQLDRKPHRLKVSVIQDSDLTEDELNAELSGENLGETGGRIRGNVYRSTTGLARGAVQELQTLDGRPATVQSGASQPVPAPYGYGYGGTGIGYQSASTGFTVTPRLSGGGEAVVDVSPWMERFRQDQGGAIQQQGGETQVRIPLGRWTSVAGQTDSLEIDESNFAGHRYATRRQNHQIFLKIDDLDSGEP